MCLLVGVVPCRKNYNWSKVLTTEKSKYAGELFMQVLNIEDDIFAKPKYIVNLMYRENRQDHVLIKGSKEFDDYPDMELLREMLNSATNKFDAGEFDNQLDLYFGYVQIESN